MQEWKKWSERKHKIQEENEPKRIKKHQWNEKRRPADLHQVTAGPATPASQTRNRKSRQNLTELPVCSRHRKVFFREEPFCRRSDSSSTRRISFPPSLKMETQTGTEWKQRGGRSCGSVLADSSAPADGTETSCQQAACPHTHTHTHRTHTHTQCSRWGASTSQRCHFSVSCSGRSALTFYEALCRNQQLVMAAGLSLLSTPHTLPLSPFLTLLLRYNLPWLA